MLKSIILVIAIFSNALAGSIVYSGTAHYEKSSFFGTKERSYEMKIDFTDDGIILSLPEYGCVTKLLLASQNSNISTYKEEHIKGPCKIDQSASTQIRVEANKIDYLWQSDGEKLTAVLNKN